MESTNLEERMFYNMEADKERRGLRRLLYDEKGDEIRERMLRRS